MKRVKGDRAPGKMVERDYGYETNIFKYQVFMFHPPFILLKTRLHTANKTGDLK